MPARTMPRCLCVHCGAAGDSAGTTRLAPRESNCPKGGMGSRQQQRGPGFTTSTTDQQQWSEIRCPHQGRCLDPVRLSRSSQILATWAHGRAACSNAPAHVPISHLHWASGANRNNAHQYCARDIPKTDSGRCRSSLGCVSRSKVRDVSANCVSH